jgi:long-chain acyl-CoA synthetase
MLIDHLLKVFQMNQEREAIIWKSASYNYLWLKKAIENWVGELGVRKIKQGNVVALQADYSPNAVALLIALTKLNCIVIPLTTKNKVKLEEYCKIAQVEFIITVDSDDNAEIEKLNMSVDHKIILEIKAKKHPGLIIFSSGSTGKSKAAVHDFVPLFEKFKISKRRTRVIAFLLFDHIGGLNTLFYTLFNGGCLITLENRTPKEVCEAIEKFNADALTTTPTFLNLLILSEIYNNYDLNSLRFVNYGTEVMPESTLLKLRTMLPNVRLSQAYGLSELGVLSTRSKSSDSLFIKFEGNEFNIRVVNGLLEIKAKSSMLGYLNAPSPFTNDGWFKTGDAVEIDGDYVRVLGRTSELINVGGEKVYPAEIENVIQNLDGVEQVSVYSEHNAITGQIVVAKIKLSSDEKLSQFKVRLHIFCKLYLTSYKIPQKIILTKTILHNDRFKKIRNSKEAIQ